jgi:putative peptidoglycan lipid II flippase
MIISSILPTGAISYLYYADRVGQLPLGIIGIAISTALLPILSRHAKAGRLEELCRDNTRAVEMSLLLALPAAVALIVSARPIMAALFMRGAFTEADVIETASALRAYAVGIPAAILVKILMAGFFARENTKTPLKFTLITIAANTALALTLIQWLSFTGIALATGITTWINVVLLGRRLRKENLLTLDARLFFSLSRLALSAAGMACVLVLIDHLFQGWWMAATLKRFIAIGVLVGAGGLTYIGLAFATGVLNSATVKIFLKRKGA